MDSIQCNRYAKLCIMLAKLYKELADLHKELNVILDEILSKSDAIDMDAFRVKQNKRNAILNEIEVRERKVKEIRSYLKL